MRRIVSLVLITLSVSAKAQNPADLVTALKETQLEIWQDGVRQVMAMAEAMPEEHYRYQPTDSLMTFAGQIVHLAVHSKELAYWSLNDRRLEGLEQIKQNGPQWSKIELLKLLQSSLDEITNWWRSTTNEKLLERKETFYGKKMTRLEGFLFVHDHLTNHKAKLNMYLRMKDVAPVNYQYY